MSGYFKFGDATNYRDLVGSALSTQLPAGLNPLCYEKHNEPPDFPTERETEKNLRPREANRRQSYHDLFDIPGDKRADIEWARQVVTGLLREIALKDKGIMFAYAVIDSWRQLLFLSAFPDVDASEWERNAPNKPYLAWSRMEQNLKSLAAPNLSLMELSRRELKQAQSLTGTIGAYARRTISIDSNLARLVCLLVELEDLSTALEEVIISWKNLIKGE